MINRFDNLTNHINDLTSRIEVGLETHREFTARYWQSVLIQEYFYRIDNSIEILKNQINNVHEILAFAKIRIISRHILTKDELIYIHEHLNKNNVNIASDEEIYELLELKAYYNRTSIIIAIQIPQFYNDPLTYYHIKPVPINTTEIIPISTNSIILNPQVYMMLTKPCSIIENVYYCQKEQVYSVINSCVPNILLNQNANCTTTSYNEMDDIDYLEDEFLYVSSNKGIEFYSTCKNQNATIQGRKLLHFKNCSVTINNVQYSNEYKVTFNKILIIQPFDSVNVTTKMEDPISLPRLANQTIKNMESIDSILTYHKQYKINDYIISGSTITLISCIALVMCYIYNKYKQDSRFIKQNMQINISKSDVEDDANLRREELCNINDPPVIRSTSINTQ